MKTRVTLQYFKNDCPWKPLFDFNWPQTPLNLDSLTTMFTLTPFPLL